MNNTKFEIVTAQSNIDWVGRKVTGSHNGTIDIKAGSLIVSDNNVTGGNIVIDTTSIKILDVTDPATNAQFAGHLASDDFFSIDKFPEASLEIKSVTGNRVQGDLTIKSTTHPVTFTAAVNVNGDTLVASGKMAIDRTKYDMKFRSGNFFQNLGDTLIYNEFDLDINITAKAVNN